MSESVAALAHAPAFRTVLVIIENPAVRDLLASHLRDARLLPLLAASAQEGRWLAGEIRPDAVLVDADAPVTAQWLAASQSTAVQDAALTVVLSSRPMAAPSERADTATRRLWIGKPFTPRDIVRMLNTQLGRERTVAFSPGPDAIESTLRLGPLELDPLRHEVRIARRGRTDRVSLPPGELALLRCLMEHEGNAVSREQIVAAIWGPDHAVDMRTVDQNVKRLRKHLGEHCGRSMIQTQRGYGYRLHFGMPTSRPRGAHVARRATPVPCRDPVL